MLTLASESLLALWEDGAPLHPVDRALLVLRVIWPEHEHGALASVSVGRRDAMLLDARRRLFGDRMEASTICPACHEPLELTLSCASLLTSEFFDEPIAAATESMTVDGYDLALRAPDSRDLAAAARCRNVEEASALLFDRLVTGAGASRELPSDVRRAAIERLAELDAYAEIRLDLSCSACGHAWQDLLDALTFTWADVSWRAQRLLQEVLVLARAYGWSERDILEMTAARRSAYLQLALQ